jgi:hypothetical protein
MVYLREATDLINKQGIKQELNKDYGFGPIDLVWDFNVHPGFRPIICGFIELKEQEGGSKDLDDGQFSLRKIEEAVMTGIRSGMDRLFLFCGNENVAKSVAGQIQWLSSRGSLIRYDSYCQVIFPGENGQTSIASVEKKSLSKNATEPNEE